MTPQSTFWLATKVFLLVVGALYTAGAFNYELVREYVLTIEAKDEGDPPMSDSCAVYVYVSDANDNPPVFSQASYSASVREDAKVNDIIIGVSGLPLVPTTPLSPPHPDPPPYGISSRRVEPPSQLMWQNSLLK